MKLKKDAEQSLYMQLMFEIKAQIESGYDVAGDKIPTEVELGKIYNVSRITIRKTVEELCKLGYLEKKQGKGTFVKSPKIHRKIEMRKSQSFSKTCQSANVKAQSHILETKIITADKGKREFLKLNEEDRVIYIKRLRLVEQIPIIQEELYLPEKLFAGFDVSRLEDGSLFKAIMEDLKLKAPPVGVSEIEAINAGMELSRILKINPGDAVLNMTTYWSDTEGNPLYIGYENIVGNRYRITI